MKILQLISAGSIVVGFAWAIFLPLVGIPVFSIGAILAGLSIYYDD